MASCVRLLRGDFCGHGIAFTVDGTPLNLHDNIGVQVDTDPWRLEAERTPNGARCVNSTNDARYQAVLATDPACVKPLMSATCGASCANGAILTDELR